MGTTTMGKVLVKARIENLGDLELRDRGLLNPDQVRFVEVEDALIDTGATGLHLPKSMIAKLGLRLLRTRTARGLSGIVAMPIYATARLTIQDRECPMDVGEVSDDFPVIVGQIPLESLDFVVDPKGQRLIGNPAHGGDHVMEVF